MKSRQPISIVEEFGFKFVSRILSGIVALSILGATIHLAWMNREQQRERNRISEALANTLDEWIGERDLVGIQRTLMAFENSTKGVKVCVALDDNIHLGSLPCTGARYAHEVRLTGASYQVYVDVSRESIWNNALLSYVLGTLCVGVYVYFYVRGASRKLISDVAALGSEGSETWNFKELSEASERILKGLKASIDLERSRTDALIGQIAARVAHDIRSPVAALSAVRSSFETLPVDAKRLVTGALDRIESISGDLLEYFFSTEGARKTVDKKAKKIQLISTLHRSFIEKKTELINTQVALELRLGTGIYSAFSILSEMEFQRIISNLMNNAFQAMESGGRMVLALECDHVARQAYISISDTGKGIPDNILRELGQRNLTYGKVGGSGLGVYNAKVTIQGWGGNIRYSSLVNVGTTVTVTLPLEPAPSGFTEFIDLSRSKYVVVLDDDPATRQCWASRLAGKVMALASVGELSQWLKEHRDIAAETCFLIGNHLYGESCTGRDLISSLDIASQSYLITDDETNAASQSHVADHRIRVIPKELVNFIPIKMKQI